MRLRRTPLSSVSVMQQNIKVTQDFNHNPDLHICCPLSTVLSGLELSLLFNTHVVFFLSFFPLRLNVVLFTLCVCPHFKNAPPPNNEIPKTMFLAKINIKQAKKSQNNSYLNKSKNKWENKFWKYETVAHHPRQSYSKSTSTTGTKCPKRIQ